MIGCAACVWHAFAFQAFGQVTGDVAQAVVGKQARTMNHICLFEPRFLQRQIQYVMHI